MYLVQKPTNPKFWHEVEWYPYATAERRGPSGWAVDVRNACHYATREMAEQVIENLKASGVDMTGARIVEDPLPVNERIGLAMRRLDSKWNY